MGASGLFQCSMILSIVSTRSDILQSLGLRAEFCVTAAHSLPGSIKALEIEYCFDGRRNVLINWYFHYKCLWPDFIIFEGEKISQSLSNFSTLSIHEFCRENKIEGFGLSPHCPHSSGAVRGDIQNISDGEGPGRRGHVWCTLLQQPEL